MKIESNINNEFCHCSLRYFIRIPLIPKHSVLSSFTQREFNLQSYVWNQNPLGFHSNWGFSISESLLQWPFFPSILLTSWESLPRDGPSVTRDACQTRLNATYYPWCLESLQGVREPMGRATVLLPSWGGMIIHEVLPYKVISLSHNRSRWEKPPPIWIPPSLSYYQTPQLHRQQRTNPQSPAALWKYPHQNLQALNTKLQLAGFRVYSVIIRTGIKWKLGNLTF